MLITDRDKIKIFDAMAGDWMRLVPARYVKKALRLVGVTELAGKLGCSPTAIRRLLDKGQIENGKYVLKKNQYWTVEQVRAIEVIYNNLGKYKPGRRSNITVQQQKEMIGLWRMGWKQADIAFKYGITQSDVSRWVHGKRVSSVAKI